jgi:signal transduction histidine kinase
MTIKKQEFWWWALILILVGVITALHYLTPTMRWQYHLIYMQSYFVPILIASFRFGLRGGVGSALIISMVYFPHIMLQWGGLIETNLMRFLQIVLFNVIGFLTGYLAQRERKETQRYQSVASQLEDNIEKIRVQSEKIQTLEDQLRTSDRLAVVGELTACLAHEIRNPLASMRGTVEIIRDQLPGLFKDSEWITIMQAEIERMNRVVENYLNFSGKPLARDTEFDIREIITNAHLMLGAQFRKQDVQLNLTLPDYSLQVTGNSDHLWQVITNLLLNALEAMSGKEVGSVNIRAIAHGHAIKVEVQDEGCGIPEDQLTEIFRPFYTTRDDGTGLGLAIVKRIVDTHGWNIDIQSTINQGTTFQLTIPDLPSAK